VQGCVGRHSKNTQTINANDDVENFEDFALAA